MPELGIAVKATKQLNAILDAVGDLQKLENQAGKVKSSLDEMSKDDATKKLTSEIRKLSSEGSEELQKIRKAYQDIEQAGGKASKKQIDDLKLTMREYKAFAAQGIESTQLFEIGAAKQLGARVAVGDLPPEQKLPLQELQSQMKRGALSRMQRAEVDVMQSRLPGMGDQGGSGVGALAGAKGAWSSVMKTAGTLLVGASIVGLVKHWADLDTQLTQVDQKFKGMRGTIDTLGIGMGKLVTENVAFANSLGEVTNKFDQSEALQLMGYAKATGTTDAGALQLRLAGRYARIPGTAQYLSMFDKFAGRMGMGEGRREELQAVTQQLAQSGASQRLGLGIGNVFATELFAKSFWGNQYEQRGMGEWGADFIQRLNAGMMGGGNDANRSFLMRAYGFGKGKTLSQVQKRIQAGIWGEGNLQDMISQMYQESPGMGREERIQALQGITGGQLKTFEIERMIDQVDQTLSGGGGIGDVGFLKTLRQTGFGGAATNWARKGAATTTQGQKYRTFIDRIQKELGGVIKSPIDLFSKSPGAIIKEIGSASKRVLEQMKSMGISLDDMGTPGGVSSEQILQDIQSSVNENFVLNQGGQRKNVNVGVGEYKFGSTVQDSLKHDVGIVFNDSLKITVDLDMNEKSKEILRKVVMDALQEHGYEMLKDGELFFAEPRGKYNSPYKKQ